MRVLLHCADRGLPLYGPSGGSAHLRGVARALGRAGHDVRISVSAEVDGRGRFGRPLDGPVFEAPHHRWPRGLRSLGAAVDAGVPVRRAMADGWRPDWVWERLALHSGVPGFALRGRFRWLVEINAPVVIERRAAGAGVSPAVARRVAERLRVADRVIAVSTWLANHAVDEGASPERVRVVRNGVEPAPLHDHRRTRARLPVPDAAELVVGFVGTFKPAHGVERLPAIIDALGPRAWLVAVGRGPVPVPRHPRIVELGYVAPDRVAEVVAGFDVGLAPYDRDAPPWFCPLKVLEYRSQGVPVVGGPLPELARLLGSRGGEVVDDDDPSTWRDAVRRQAGRRPPPLRRTWDDVVAEALR